MADLPSFTRRDPAAAAVTSPSAARSAARPTAARRNFPGPRASGRQTALTVGLLVAASLAAAVATAVGDARLPDGREWYIVGILAGVAVIGAISTARFGPADDGSSPPWDPHTVWLLPAALLTPPLAFGGLVFLSVAFTLAKRIHPLMLRVVVSCITVLTTCALHSSAQLVGTLALAALLGIVALWLIGVVVAILAAHIFVTPSGTATWLDYRWSLVLMGCAFSGMAAAGAMVVDPLFGVAALAPLLLAAFALRWPELDRQASVDAKTGLSNARAWEDRSRELLAAAALHGTPAAIMILDIDKFKVVNDTYGHLAGDHVLVGLAETLRSQVHPGDVIGRFGGEEFVVTMFELSSAEAVAAAERIRAAVAAQRHRLLAVGPARAPGAGTGAATEGRADGVADAGARTPVECTVTCTVGVASSDAFGYDFAELLRHADDALVAGKASGRNQVRDAAAEPGPGVDAVREGGAAALAITKWWNVATHQTVVRRERRERLRGGQR